MIQKPIAKGEFKFTEGSLNEEIFMVMATDMVLRKYFEFRGAIDSTIELYCSLCHQVIYEMHEDHVQDGLAIAKEHFKDFHEGNSIVI